MLKNIKKVTPKWMPVYSGEDKENYALLCSCGMQVQQKYNYCPCCGAKLIFTDENIDTGMRRGYIKCHKIQK